jgi:hypothetical protein
MLLAYVGFWWRCHDRQSGCRTQPLPLQSAAWLSVVDTLKCPAAGFDVFLHNHNPILAAFMQQDPEEGGFIADVGASGDQYRSHCCVHIVGHTWLGTHVCLASV